jgi:hypothetical protein
VDNLRSAGPGGPASAFLIERYLPASAAGNLATSVANVAGICAELVSSGNAVRYLQSIYVPADDTCFCVFQALSSESVRAVNEIGRFPFDRITEAVLQLS